MNMDKNILEIPIEDILPNRFQPRLAFNEEGINELADSIKQHGIIQPLVVRKLGDKYEIIAGERRYKAATMAGLAKVPVIISDIDDNKSAEVALVENIQRRNLTAIEEAKSYKNLLDRGYLTQEQLASKMGVSQSAIANKLRLLNLDEEVQEALLNEKISERHARALLSLENKEDQKKWLKRIINERLTVRQLDMELKKLQENGGEEGEEIKLVDINPNIDEIVSNAEDIVVERPLHDVASMLIPEGGQAVEEKKEETEPVKSPNKFFNFLEDEQANMNVVEPEEMNAFTVTPVLEEVKAEPIEQQIVQEAQPESTQPPTLDSILNPEVQEETPSIDTILNQSIEEPKVVNEVETLDDLDDDISIEDLEKAVKELLGETNIEELENTLPSNMLKEETAPSETVVEQLTPINNDVPIEEPIAPIEPVTILDTPVMDQPILEEPIKVPFEPIETQSIVEEPIVDVSNQPIIETNQVIEEKPQDNAEIKPFKSIFFTNDEDETSNAPIVEENPILNNTIQEVEPIVEEPIVDPLDRIVTLEPDYEQKQEELAGRDLKTAINIVRDTVKDLENRGFIVEIEEADLEDLYHITIKIDKDNKAEDSK